MQFNILFNYSLAILLYIGVETNAVNTCSAINSTFVMAVMFRFVDSVNEVLINFLHRGHGQ